MNRYSKTQSRCDCGHKIILVDGHWQHAGPHPDHACTCKEPKPSDRIRSPSVREKEPVVECGIATTGLSMERREGWLPGEGA